MAETPWLLAIVWIAATAWAVVIVRAHRCRLSFYQHMPVTLQRYVQLIENAGVM